MTTSIPEEDWELIQSLVERIKHREWEQDEDIRNLNNLLHALHGEGVRAKEFEETICSHPLSDEIKKVKEDIINDVIDLINANCHELEGKRLKITPMLLCQKIDALRGEEIMVNPTFDSAFKKCKDYDDEKGMCMNETLPAFTCEHFRKMGYCPKGYSL